MNKYASRVTSSARGKGFNPLTWPFFITTMAYGLGFAAFYSTDAVGASSLFIAMSGLNMTLPYVWGGAAILTIIMGFTFLLFNIPPAGKLSGLVGFMLWVFASFCWALAGGWLLVISVGVPNMYFWIWQYLSLSLFRREDAADKISMHKYNTGGFDDIDPMVNSKAARLNNRGVDRQ